MRPCASRGPDGDAKRAPGPPHRHSSPRAGIQGPPNPSFRPPSRNPGATEPVIPAPKPESRDHRTRHSGPRAGIQEPPNPSFRPPSRNPGATEPVIPAPKPESRGHRTRHSGPEPESRGRGRGYVDARPRIKYEDMLSRAWRRGAGDRHSGPQAGIRGRGGDTWTPAADSSTRTCFRAHDGGRRRGPSFRPPSRNPGAGRGRGYVDARPRIKYEDMLSRA